MALASLSPAECLILCNSDFATGVAGLSVAWGHWAGLPGT